MAGPLVGSWPHNYPIYPADYSGILSALKLAKKRAHGGTDELFVLENAMQQITRLMDDRAAWEVDMGYHPDASEKEMNAAIDRGEYAKEIHALQLEFNKPSSGKR